MGISLNRQQERMHLIMNNIEAKAKKASTLATAETWNTEVERLLNEHENIKKGQYVAKLSVERKLISALMNLTKARTEHITASAEYKEINSQLPTQVESVVTKM